MVMIQIPGRRLNLISAAFTIAWLSACSTVPIESPKSEFAFIDTLSPNTAASLQAYRSHQALPNGQEYGASVRNLNLQGHSAQSLDKTLKDKSCPRRDDVIREPKKNAPILDAKGKPTPLWVWLCPDGGVVRAKPVGDPTNRFRPQPHASKALRYPADSKYEKFEDETLKIDNQGEPLPKWPADLAKKDPTHLNNWANAAHTDLLIPSPSSQFPTPIHPKTTN